MNRAEAIRFVMLATTLLAAAAVATAADDPTPPPAGSSAAAPAPAAEAQIPFAKRNIWNWQVVDDQTVLIQDQGRRWYKASLFSHCIGLPFANTIAFDSNPGGTFDKFSAILARGQRCPLRSLVETTAPPKKTKAKKPDPAPATQ
ncbi:MAG: DUF6491 family protein [Steroidobacteraceae bacterium]